MSSIKSVMGIDKELRHKNERQEFNSEKVKVTCMYDFYRDRGIDLTDPR